MATRILRCEAHGESTRLTCVECDRPICPKCMVRTEVGLKCVSCSQPVVAVAPARPRLARVPLLLGLGGLALLAAAAAVLLSRPSAPPAAPAPRPLGRWTEAPDLASIRGTTVAAVLRDGRVLVAGGGVGAIPLAATEVYDPESGGWTATGPLVQARRGHQAVVLGDGRVLVAGGIAEGELLASAEIYDPASRSWWSTRPMSTPRLGHSLTLLADGRVLAAGGTALGAAEASGSGQTIRPEPSTEIYDPSSGAWTPAGSMTSPRFEHTATLLGDGRVLIAGGLGPVGGKVAPLASTELYDPPANAFVRSTEMGEGRANHAAAPLSDRSVLVSGGAGGSDGEVSLASAEVFDAQRGTWTTVGPLAQTRRGATATPLADGRVLVAGGESATRGNRSSLGSAELFDPAKQAWSPAGTMQCPRSEHAAVRLGDGSVLVVAGDAAFPGKAPIAQSCASRYVP
jgi:hypothetical protein